MTNNPTMPEGAQCLECGYSLRGLIDSRCPECGTRFNPNNRDSYSISRDRYEWLRRGRTALLRLIVAPPGVLAWGTVLFLGPFLLYTQRSLVAWIQWRESGGRAIVVGLLIFAMVRIALSPFVLRQLDPLLFPPAKSQRKLRFAAFLVFSVLLIASSQPWSQRIRFALSDQQLREAIRTSL